MDHSWYDVGTGYVEFTTDPDPELLLPKTHLKQISFIFLVFDLRTNRARYDLKDWGDCLKDLQNHIVLLYTAWLECVLVLMPAHQKQLNHYIENMDRNK